MNNRYRNAATATLVSALVLMSLERAFAAPPSQVDALKDWSVQRSGPPGLFASDASVPLKNETNNECIRYGERDYGINLVWDSSCNRSVIKFKRASGTGSIKYGEPLAIHVLNGGYVRYREREYGINLVWSETPVYEWEIRGRDSGEFVYTTAKFSLYNRTIKDYVVYCVRSYGINLRWARDCDRIQPPQEYRTTVYLQPQPIVQGFIPFSARFPATGASNGKLKEVTLREQYTGELVVLFVKPGFTTSQCGSASAVVALREGRTLTADEMRAVFGASEPSLPVNLVGCVSKNPLGSVAPVLLNVVWVS